MGDVEDGPDEDEADEDELKRRRPKPNPWTDGQCSDASAHPVEMSLLLLRRPRPTLVYDSVTPSVQQSPSSTDPECEGCPLPYVLYSDDSTQ